MERSQRAETRVGHIGKRPELGLRWQRRWLWSQFPESLLPWRSFCRAEMLAPRALRGERLRLTADQSFRWPRRRITCRRGGGLFRWRRRSRIALLLPTVAFGGGC